MIRMLPTTTTTSVIIGPFSQPGQARRRASARFVPRVRARGVRRSGDDKGDPLVECTNTCFGGLYQPVHGLSSTERFQQSHVKVGSAGATPRATPFPGDCSADGRPLGAALQSPESAFSGRQSRPDPRHMDFDIALPPPKCYLTIRRDSLIIPGNN